MNGHFLLLFCLFNIFFHLVNIELSLSLIHISPFLWTKTTENQISTFLLYRFFKLASTGNRLRWIRAILYISDYFFRIYFFLLLSLFLSQLLSQSFELLKIATKIFANIKNPITKCMESVVRYCRSKPSFR